MSVREVVADDPLLAAAFDAFARHGFRRTTMADVASAAGMSRPALYLRVSNKEELLRLVADAMLAHSLAAAQTAAETTGDIAARAEAVLAAKLDLLLGLAARSEHAAELLEQYNALAPAEVAAYDEKLVAILAGVLAGGGADRERCAALADALLHAVVGLERSLDQPDRARALLRELTATVAAGL